MIKTNTLLTCLLGVLITWSCQKKELPPPPGGAGSGGTGSGTGTGGNNNIPKPLVANAGPDQRIVLPQNSAILNGDRSFDSSGRTLTFNWRKITGPASATLVDSIQSRATVQNLVAGTYTFELKVSVNNPYAFSLDTTQVTVLNPPVANAGPDQTLVLPQNSTTLNGERSFDSSGQALTFSWRMINGSPAASIANPSQSRTVVQNLSVGTYSFELKVSVNNPYAFSLDTTLVTVVNPPNCQFNRPEIPAQLTYLGDLPASPEFPEMVVADNKLLIPRYWDWTSGQTSNPIDIYDIQSRSWSVTTLGIPREGICVAVAGTKVYFAGGLTYNPVDVNLYTPSNRIDIYDVATNTWTSDQLSEPRALCKAAVAGNKLIFAGGLKANNTLSAKVDVLDLSSNQWSSTLLAGGPRSITSAVTVQNKVFFCGGYSRYEDPTGFGYTFTNPVRDIDIYDGNTGQWSRGEMRNAKGNFAAISYQNKIYLAGGETEYGSSFDVEILDAATLQSTITCLSSYASFFNFMNSSCVKNTDILFFPTITDGPFKNKIDIYHTATGSWSLAKIPPANPGSFSELGSAVSVNNTVYVIFNKKLYSLGI